jgi:hypothetical protein
VEEATMIYLTVILVPPLYFVLRKKWGAFALNAILYGIAWLFVLTIFLIFVAPIFWLLAVGHAGWHLRKEIMVEHAELIATKMAEKLRPQG